VFHYITQNGYGSPGLPSVFLDALVLMEGVSDSQIIKCTPVS
jgi:hypothetical protein